MFVPHYNPSLNAFSCCALCSTCENLDCAVLHSVIEDNYFGHLVRAIPDVLYWDFECASYSDGVTNHE